jgi:CubicO group peptidase (beta-lactamase class C family)
LVEPANPGIRDALAHAFAEPGVGPRRNVHAIVVVHDGKLIAERYAPGFTPDTPQLGYSVAKSVVHALVGILVREGRLDPHAAAPVAAWRGAGDPRAAITLDQLLRMQSGLDLAEDDSGFDPVSTMLFRRSDMAAYASAARLRSKPGATWEYTSGNTLIVCGVLRDVVGDGAPGMLRFAHEQLFAPLGMRHVLLEFDGAQTLIGSTRIYASARDWARLGQLYLDDGVVNGRRILPAGWAESARTPTLDSPYGAGFWTNVGNGAHPHGAITALPEGAFLASGSQGQRVVVWPSRRLVVVRLGTTIDPPNYDIAGLGRLLSELAAALP